MTAQIRIAMIALVLVPALFDFATPVFAADRHVGIYYPDPQTREEYIARAETLPNVDRHRRIDFVNGLTAHMLASPYPPQFAIFAKGTHAEKLIIVSLYDNSLNTIYRARALLAMLTAVSRQTPYFRKNGVDDSFAFYDLLVLLGFKRLTISDGEDFAYQVDFK